jgi:flagellar biosynthesis protein FliR
MSALELQRLLVCGVLAWARCLPLFWLTPALGMGVVPGGLGLALALGLGLALTPLYAAGLPLSAAAFGPTLWLAAGAELVRGGVIALGLSLPALVLRLSGAITEGLFGWDTAARSSKLGRLTGLAALVVAASADGHLGALRLLLSDPPVLPTRLGFTNVRELLMPVSQLLVQAVGLGVSLSGALLLGSLLGVLIMGILARLSASARPQELGAALWPGLGLSLLCLSAPRWLSAVPDLLRGFAQGTARILSGLP